MASKNFTIAAVIVTYNRINDLIKSLETYENQDENPDAIIIINNCSTDGTNEFLNEWKQKKSEYEKYVISLSENAGGAGGFYEGLKFAMDKKFDWIWLHDDDAYLEPDCIKRLRTHIEENEESKTSAICSSVIEYDKIALGHRKIIKQGFIKVIDKPVESKMYEKPFFELNMFSYVGIAINRKKLEDVGLTNKDFFIHHDDSEHSYRLSKVGKILCYPDIKVHHAHKNNNAEGKLNWKFYYNTRNKLYFIKKYFSKISYYHMYIYMYLLAINKKYRNIKKKCLPVTFLL